MSRLLQCRPSPPPSLSTSALSGQTKGIPSSIPAAIPSITVSPPSPTLPKLDLEALGLRFPGPETAFDCNYKFWGSATGGTEIPEVSFKEFHWRREDSRDRDSNAELSSTKAIIGTGTGTGTGTVTSTQTISTTASATVVTQNTNVFGKPASPVKSTPPAIPPRTSSVAQKQLEEINRRFQHILENHEALVTLPLYWGLESNDVSCDENRVEGSEIGSKIGALITAHQERTDPMMAFDCAPRFVGLLDWSFEEDRLEEMMSPVQHDDIVKTWNTILCALADDMFERVDDSSYLSQPPKFESGKFFFQISRAYTGLEFYRPKEDRAWRRKCSFRECLNVQHDWFFRIREDDQKQMTPRGNFSQSGLLRKTPGGVNRIFIEEDHLIELLPEVDWPTTGYKGDKQEIKTTRRKETGGLLRADSGFTTIIPRDTLLPIDYYPAGRLDPFVVKKGTNLRREVYVEDLENYEPKPMKPRYKKVVASSSPLGPRPPPQSQSQASKWWLKPINGPSIADAAPVVRRTRSDAIRIDRRRR
ncbi:hypothetical protein BZA77DRAFT_294768 [Pyronema omphalodes]|nr:hypothetical protein BZA77DRAFT_294768 [Pyronema omphalodes]